MLWDMKKKKVDPLAYAARVRKDADRMQAMSEAFGSHEKLALEKTTPILPEKQEDISDRGRRVVIAVNRYVRSLVLRHRHGALQNG